MTTSIAAKVAPTCSIFRIASLRLLAHLMRRQHAHCTDTFPDHELLCNQKGCDWRRKVSGVGSITDLAEANPSSVFLIALSSAYLSVIKDDLLAARLILESPDNLVIISAGTRTMPEMGTSLLPIDARFENLVGGGRATLNARMLRYIVENFDVRKCNARKITKSLNITATDLAKPKLFDRARLDDVEIAAFIHKQSKLVRKTSASALLRILRDAGTACEHEACAGSSTAWLVSQLPQE